MYFLKNIMVLVGEDSHKSGNDLPSSLGQIISRVGTRPAKQDLQRYEPNEKRRRRGFGECR